MNLNKLTKNLLVIASISIITILISNLIVPLQINNVNELNKIVTNYSLIQTETNSVKLKDFSIINEKLDTLKISSLILNSKLIYRFSELHCSSCIDKEFENLRNYIASRKLKKEDIIIISYYQNYRNLKIFKRINKLQEFEIYNLINNNIDSLKIDKIGQPYFFTLDKDLHIDNTFIPIKAYNQRTLDYFKKIIKT